MNRIAIDSAMASRYTLYIMIAIVSRWGNSLALRIPKAAVEAANLREGDTVTITEEAGGLRIVRDTQIDIHALISKITTENLHRDEDWIAETPRGAEL